MTMQYPTNHPTPTDPAHSPTRSILVSRGSPVPRVHAPPPVPASNEANDGYYGMPAPALPRAGARPPRPRPSGPPQPPALDPLRAAPRGPPRGACPRDVRRRVLDDAGAPRPAPVSQQAHQYPPQPQYQYRRPAPVPLQPQHQVPGPRRTAAYQSLRSLYVADLHREKMIAEQDVPGEEQDITELIASQRGW
ncbi:uncharacterized protein BXZ73DRAFT_98492 [Epithele typhae]|uniref:uncharacterized protein n=1 Tax=Epithele typhae TaxID=378194 RepID=UPI002008E5CC|nr:uncharacterized protein BXZ73DRAFT_98492 [Epithele typhae]KAH9941275.1 hypothetical protein BXZ73DRAFT_98492 [Epithele typhae]